MTKAIGPLLSLQARGRLGQAVTFKRSPTGTLAISVAQVKDQRTAAQLIYRERFRACATAWHGLSEERREYYRLLNTRSNYNAAYINFMGVCLMPAYLDDLLDVELTAPADGEIIVFDILTGLWKNQPAPVSDAAYGAGWNGVTDVAPSKNATFAEIEAHKAIAAAHHARYLDAEAVAVVKAVVKLNELQAPTGAIACGAQVLDNIGAPVDAGDALRKGTRFGKEQFQWTLNKLLLGAGVGADPTEINVPTPTPTASGTYAGSRVANRAIPHGLGVTPKIVILLQDNDKTHRILAGIAFIFFFTTALFGSHAVTAPGATNFYVGNPNDWEQSANENGKTYYWVALG